MNIILDDKQREARKETISELHKLCPQTITKKIPRANIQQAFVLDQVRKLSKKDSKLLCVGHYEDTACESLKKLGYDVVEIDPAINYSLDQFFKQTTEKFDVIFSTSVIEHVPDDELFINQICQLLKTGGYGVLTCDFNNNYKHGDGKPVEDYRLYTKNDLLVRFKKILDDNNCIIYGEVDYDKEPDFTYSGFIYTFATYVFKKK